MIYTTGTVSTVSGSAIVSGTGTKWTVNNPAIRSGTIILIKNGNANFIYMVDRVNSDTELVISQPATFTVKNTSYSINLTEPNSYSDANNRMTAIASDTTYFLRAMDQWMMNNGVVTVELSNGQKVTLDSIKKMQGDIGKKADDDKTIHIGDLGLGDNNAVINYLKNIDAIDYKNGSISFFNRVNTNGTLPFSYGYINAFNGRGGTGQSQVAYEVSTGKKINMAIRQNLNNSWGEWVYFYNTSNTTTDPQGFIKKASPIIDINPDGTFTTNDESEGATVTRVAQGEYLIEGVLGFNSDAGWGGVDGGIEIPLDVNKQPLIWVDSKVMKDGSILVRTYHRTYPNSPKFARNDIDGYKDGDPIDIPDGRFISVRVQMPEQSIYNVRMCEMEEAQKAEEERRQKEEEMKSQFGLGENDVLL
ncbi:hypothetical protein JEP02_00555 [Proteus mirabilis]|nr:hypothetical protein [Proteus mirabilis]MBI6323290.1 hypothetical protein [Proteus mirabilis]